MGSIEQSAQIRQYPCSPDGYNDPAIAS